MMRGQAKRQAIEGAARRLFSERGYFATKVDDIAALARVAPATVYAVSGGKQGLLRTLTETATTDPAIEAAIGSIERLDDPSAILRLVAATVRSMREQFGDVVRVQPLLLQFPTKRNRDFAAACQGILDSHQ
jgi:AcrR family transcriptional regulator